MGRDYSHQIKEFEKDKKAIEVLKRKSEKLEVKHQTDQRKLDADLDMVPTKQNKGKTLPEYPIFFKHSKIESSIPKAGGIIRRPKQTISHTTSTKSFNKSPAASAKKEVTYDSQRASSGRMTTLDGKPNAHLAEMHATVTALQNKMEPLLQRVEQAQVNAMMARKTHETLESFAGTKPSLRGLLSQQEGKVGVMARMGGRLINFYSEDLTNMLLDDILVEVVRDLQHIESLEKNKQTVHQTKELAHNLLKEVMNYETEAQAVEMRWKAPTQQPKTRELGVPGDTPILEPSAVELKEGYLNPFEASLSINAQHILDRASEDIDKTKQINLVGGPSTEVYQAPPRKWKLGLDKNQKQKIEQYREKFGKYLEMHNQTRSYDVWKVYDHVAKELMMEQVD